MDQTARKFSAGFKEEEFRVCESRLAACRIQHLACSSHQFEPSLSGLLLTENPQKKPRVDRGDLVSPLCPL